MELTQSIISIVYQIVWGPPLLILLLGLGVYYTIIFKGLQIRYLPRAMKLAFGRQEESTHGDITHFQSLMTALAATLGIGNIAGVATALMAGGVGALFWMWIVAILGMIVKYAEAILAVKFRVVDERGEMSGGPMYFIDRGLGWKWLAGAFACFGVLASLGGGNMLQANSIADVLVDLFGIDPLTVGLVLALLIGLSIIGGIQTIGKVASFLVPLMALFYLSGGLYILAIHFNDVPGALWSIFAHAFTGQAAFGGFLGAAMVETVRVGLSRGLMTSESGLGTASIAAAAAKTECPGRQALVSMTGSFLATVVMCSVTALVLIVTGVFGEVATSGKVLNGAAMTSAAFAKHLPFGAYGVSLAILFFGFTTILGYAYYAEKCLEYLFGAKSIPIYRVLFTLTIVLGAVLELELVWKLSDIANGLMAYPNLIALIALTGVVKSETARVVETD